MVSPPTISQRAFGLAVVILVLVMFLLPIWSFPGYSLLRNTTSHLGSQGAPHAWIMNLTFVILGGATFVGTRHGFRGYPLHVVALGGFSISLVLVGVFRHEPLVTGVREDELAARLHSIFATTTGFAFTLLAFATAVALPRGTHRLPAIVAAVSATAISLAMALIPEALGLLQRLMFLISFAWLLYLSWTTPSDVQAGPTRAGHA